MHSCRCGHNLTARRRVCNECQAEVRRRKERSRDIARANNFVSNRLPRSATAQERFEAKFIKEDGCWAWRGSVNGRGYGHFNSGASTVKAHRFAYELYVGPIPAGLHLDHLCENKSCVNPEHLEPVTNDENSRRARDRLQAA